MRGIMKNLFVAICSLLLPFSLFGSGLHFTGANTIDDPRCRYEVFYNTTPTFEDSITISFDLKLHNIQSLGDIFSLETGDGSSPVRFVYVKKDDLLCDLRLVDSNSIIFSLEIDSRTLFDSKWMPISLTIDSVEGLIMLTVDQSKFTKPYIANTKITPRLIFGCDKPFEDANDFSIKALSVGNSSKQLFFPLNEASGSIVHDSRNRNVGRVENPTWITTDAYRWRKLFEYDFDNSAAVSYNCDNELIIATRDTLFRLFLNSGALTKESYQNATPINSKLGMSYFDSRLNNLYIYELNEIPTGENSIAKLNLDSGRWSALSKKYLPRQRHHHCAHFDEQRGVYTIFGGFGNRCYSNELNQYSEIEDRWEELHFEGDTIHPRFFTSSVVESDSTLLIFGGKGNSSGDQTLGLDYFFDLYRVNLNSRRVEQLWSRDPLALGDKLIPVRQGIMANDNESFYTIMYKESILYPSMQLYKIEIKSGDYVMVGDTIPMVSGAIKSAANIFEDKNGDKFYCYTHIYDMTGKPKSTVSLYVIDSPPISLSQMNYYDSIDAQKSSKSVMAFAILFIISFVVICYRIQQNHNHKKRVQGSEDNLAENCAEQAYFTPRAEVKRNSIYLYGDFTVYDHSSINISHLFSPKIKRLFLLILFKSSENGVGVSSEEIQSTLWFGYPADKSKNLRGVTMHNLRGVLQEVDGIDVVYENGHFKVVFEAECYCDYIDALSISKSFDVSNREACEQLLSIFARGALMHHAEDSLFDTCKGESEAMALDALLKLSTALFERCEYHSVAYVCSILHKHDPMNEESLWYEVISLRHIKRPAEAKSTFMKFAKFYLENMNEQYRYNYNKFCSSTLDDILK